MGSESPLRIDLFDDVIDSIRSFDAESQRSLEKFPRLDLLPAREFSLAPEAIKDFRRRFRTRFQGDLTRMPLYRDVGEGLAPAGIEYYLPLFSSIPRRCSITCRPARRCSCREAHDARAAATRGVRWSNDMRSGASTSSTRYSIPRKSAYPPTNGWQRSPRAAARAAWFAAGTGVANAAPDTAPAVALATCPGGGSDVLDFGTGRPAPSTRIDQRREETLQAFAERLRVHARTRTAGGGVGRPTRVVARTAATV